ncbi:interleukin-2 receptor subunit beta isoform X2 [Brienomyrus brachyistius]|uniref:interleukin-2 receptor subunit beta isoform X2 n=1 Tax=Brienomyrus brachyistius TaxID=42636 RepID=UPI0020B35DEF|nr:interleukin-2 receptor subunit beta isoform X2 [Brienomyrus brachyistius]
MPKLEREADMGAVHLSLLTFLLNPWMVLSIKNLTCVNDYINNITCVWNASAVGPGAVCHLQGQKANSVRTCDLKPLMGSDGTLRGCHLVFVSNRFISLDKIPLNVTCNNSTMVRMHRYSPANFIKMHPPGRPIVLKSNVSWSPGHPLSSYIFTYKFQMQFKLEKHGWEQAQDVTTELKKWVELNEDMLEKAALYQARVRVRPEKDLLGVWSDWSPTASWRSEVGNLPSSQGFSWTVEIHVGLVVSFVIVVIFVVFLCCTYQEKWFYQDKCLHVPDPSKYFASLHSIHKGNFQKWLSPMFSPESFDILCNSEDISVLEISKEKVTPTYLEFSNLAKQWDSSGHSTFSNLGYLYSKYPSSYEIEPCSVYFSYQSGEGLLGGEQCEDDSCYEPTLQTSTSYECLAKIGDFQRHAEGPDSGFGTGQEDQEMEENEEEKVEPSRLGESAHWPASSVACPPSRASVFPAASSQPFHSFPQLPYPVPCDLGLADRPSAAVESFGVTPGRFSSVKLEPSKGGYLSLQDMELPGGNKTIGKA